MLGDLKSDVPRTQTSSKNVIGVGTRETMETESTELGNWLDMMKKGQKRDTLLP